MSRKNKQRTSSVSSSHVVEETAELESSTSDSGADTERDPKPKPWAVFQNPGPTRRADTFEPIDLTRARTAPRCRVIATMAEVSLAPEDHERALAAGMVRVRKAR